MQKATRETFDLILSFRLEIVIDSWWTLFTYVLSADREWGGVGGGGAVGLVIFE